jgi:nicotinate-nucleotide adenylyltransferase
MPDGVVQYVSKRRLYRAGEKSKDTVSRSTLPAGNNT